MTELKRGLVRVTSNYVGLLVTMLFALALVPMLLTIGDAMFGAVALLGATTGLAALLSEVVRASLVREVGVGYHADRATFLRIYNSACVVSSALAVITLVVFAALVFALVPVLNLDPEMAVAAQWFVAFKALETFVLIALAPAFNMYLVAERMVALNAWRIGIKASYLVAALMVIELTPSTESEALRLYGGLSAAFASAVVIAACICLLRRDTDLRPTLKLATRADMRSVIGVGGWNTAVRVADALHIRIGAIIMNLFFGIAGNQVFGAATLLSSYTRRVAAGLTNGLDAVSTRLSTTRPELDAVENLIHHSTRLHGLAVFPTTLLLLLLAEPFTELWIGKRLDDPLQLPSIVLLICVLLMGRTVRGIADSWTRILYGGGFVRRYAPLLIIGGLVNPALALGLVFVLPEPWKIAGPALSYSSVIFVVYGVALPIVTARCLSLGVGVILAPLLRPAAMSLVCAPILLLARELVTNWDWLSLFTWACAYGVCYWVLAYYFFLRENERSMLRSFFGRR